MMSLSLHQITNEHIHASSLRTRLKDGGLYLSPYPDVEANQAAFGSDFPIPPSVPILPQGPFFTTI